MAAVNSIETRDTAYLTMNEEDLTEKQRAVLKALLIGPMSNKAIAKHLHWPINCVTGRVKELRDQGIVEEDYVDIDAETRRPCVVWKIVDKRRGEVL